MSKKQPQNQEQKPKESKEPKEPTFAAFEDFFTKFLEKRKGYFVTKLDQIEKLEKLDQSKLQPDQVQKINNKTDTLDKIKYFDDIKSLYFESSAKKKETSVAEPQEHKSSHSRDSTIADIVNLLSIGQAIHNFENNSTSFEAYFDSEQMITVQEAFNSLSCLKTPKDVEKSKALLVNYCSNEQLQKSVKLFFEDSKTKERKPCEKDSHPADRRKVSHHEAQKESHEEPKKAPHHEAKEAPK